MQIQAGIGGDQQGDSSGIGVPVDVTRAAVGQRATAANDAELRIRMPVLGMPIDVATWREALNRIAGWVRAGEPRVVVTCNAHSIVTARRDPELRAAIESADLSTADGMSVAWFLSLLRRKRQERIAGPDLMWHYCGEAAGRNEKVFLFGSTARTLGLLAARLQRDFPGLQVVGTIAPPWGEWSARLEDELVERINASGAQVVFVGLGCPKQEVWIHHQRERISAVMIGVGAAFDFYAGTVRRAPLWMQKSGLEWGWRLAREPRRLLGRYLRTNFAFVIGAARQLLGR
ncbi:MAG: WecB/TagA/CpsF family glycosyltransferase [Burkholderiaceae bacterium]|jgi:N-acetylglucosaminyldiphosphoundecaprenol N-acetyl-beta-D-mannosaminyltransferase|nr:WecB/TagA/CpsF family glycosyltransferase [Burkholderiaceae bacterium]